MHQVQGGTRASAGVRATGRGGGRRWGAHTEQLSDVPSGGVPAARAQVLLAGEPLPAFPLSLPLSLHLSIKSFLSFLIMCFYCWFRSFPIFLGVLKHLL